jgi:hypothetical protein
MASRSTRGGRGGPGAIDFDIKSNLRQLLTDLKEFDPQLATEVRKQLRHAGDDAIKAMGDILDADAGGVVTGFTRITGRDSRGRMRLHMKDKVITREANRSRSRGTRAEIKAGLKMKVTAGKSRTTVRLATTKGDLRGAMNTRSWRHPTFGRGAWVEQPGTRYFNRGAYGEPGTSGTRERINASLQAAITVALAAIETHNATLE